MKSATRMVRTDDTIANNVPAAHCVADEWTLPGMILAPLLLDAFLLSRSRTVKAIRMQERKKNRRPDPDHIPFLSRELQRIEADEVCLSIDEHFEPQAGALLKVEIGSAYWHMWPEEFRALLQEIPDRAGLDAVHRAIERHTMHVWHGPAPRGSRDTSH